MLHEFAVDPACLTSWELLQRISDLCGFHVGRYVSDFPPRAWQSCVHSALRRKGFQQMKMVEDLLVSLQRRGGLYNSGRSFSGPRDDSAVWLINARRENSVRPFHAIVTDAEREIDSKEISPVAIDPHYGHWCVGTGRRVPREAAALIECLSPLLFQSQDFLLLVDSYFDPNEERYSEAFKAYLAHTSKLPHRFRKIEVHTRLRVDPRADDTARSGRLRFFWESCSGRFPKVVPLGMQVTIQLWEELEGSDSIHARYVLTERGGIKIDAGLDLGKPGQTTDVDLLAPTVYESRLREFQPGSKTYRHLGSLEIQGARRVRDSQ